MTAELVTPPLRRTAGWAGRASQHRRHQVRSRSEVSPVGVNELWTTVVEVLDAVPGQAGAVLCTADGASVATYGLSRSEQLRMPHEARRLIEAAPADDTASDILTVDDTAGARCTVVSRIPSHAHGDHLLLVTAVGVSAPLLHAWTSQAALDLRDLLSAG